MALRRSGPFKTGRTTPTISLAVPMRPTRIAVGFHGECSSAQGTYHKKDWLSYEEAQDVVRKAGISTQPDFMDWKERPDNFPSQPNRDYKDEGWVSWGEFLGTGRRNNAAKFLPYVEARKAVIAAGITSTKQFKSWQLPTNIPAAPHLYYKDNGWISSGEFFGTGRRIPGSDFLPYQEASEAVQKAGITTGRQLQDWKERPFNIPAAPHRIYKDKGWVSAGVFFGTGTIGKGDWLSYEDARNAVRNAGIKRYVDFVAWDARPTNIPGSPSVVYENEWQGWPKFLGI